MKIKAAQINTNKSYECASSLLGFAKNKQIDIIFIQEPNIQGGKVRGYNKQHQNKYKTRHNSNK